MSVGGVLRVSSVGMRTASVWERVGERVKCHDGIMNECLRHASFFSVAWRAPRRCAGGVSE